MAEHHEETRCMVCHADRLFRLTADGWRCTTCMKNGAPRERFAHIADEPAIRTYAPISLTDATTRPRKFQFMRFIANVAIAFLACITILVLIGGTAALSQMNTAGTLTGPNGVTVIAALAAMALLPVGLLGIICAVIATGDATREEISRQANLDRE